MLINKETRFRCDICGKPSALVLNTRSEGINSVAICEDCAKGLSVELNKMFVPKSPKNFIKKSQENNRSKL